MAREGCTATFLPNDRVLVTGGDDLWGGGSRVELFNLATRSWYPACGRSACSESPDFRGVSDHTATQLPDGRFLVLGGYRGQSEQNPWRLPVALYDSASMAWLTGVVAPMRQARAEHTATLLPDGRVLVVDGITPEGVASASEIYDPASNTQSPTGSLSEARTRHTTTLLSDGRVLVVGGLGAGYRPLASAEFFVPPPR